MADMARIRSVKPEMFTSTTVAELPTATRWTFVGLLTYADDQGRGRDEARLVKAAVWPLDDDVPWQRVAEHLDELERAGLVCRYEADGKRLLHVAGWDEHQAISHPAKPKLPACHKASHRDPPETRRRHAGDTPESRGETPLGTGNREQGKEQGKTIVEQARPVDDVAAVFHAWQTSTGKARAQLDDNRRATIRAALKTYPLDDVLDAVEGWRHDPWPERPQHNDLAQLLHTGTKRKPLNVLERMRDLARDGPPATVGPVTAGAMETYRQMQAMRPEEENGDGLERVGDAGGQAQPGLPAPPG